MVIRQDAKASRLNFNLMSMGQDSLKTALIPPERCALMTQLLAMGLHLLKVLTAPRSTPGDQFSSRQGLLTTVSCFSIMDVVLAVRVLLCLTAVGRGFGNLDLHNDPLAML